MAARQASSERFQKAGVDLGLGKYHEEMVYGIGLVYVSMINKIESYLKDFGLSPTDMNVLMLVKHRGGSKGLSQVDLGERLMVPPHNMTRAIQKLEKKGLLKRNNDHKDGRVNLVIISPKGSKLLDAIWPGYERILKNLAGRLPSDARMTLARLLQDWLNRGPT